MHIGNITLTGPPGSGKGTQSKKIVEHYPFVHVATGDILREHIAHDPVFERTVGAYINQGLLAPDAIVHDILAKWLADKTGQLLFDGFPRTVNQAEGLEKLLAKKNQDLRAVIVLQVPDEEIYTRLEKRAKTAKRSDDQTRDRIDARLHTFRHENMKVIKRYEKLHRAFWINGTGTAENVFERIKTILHHLQSTSC